MLAAKVEAFRLSLEGKTKAETDEIAVRYFCAAVTCNNFPATAGIAAAVFTGIVTAAATGIITVTAAVPTSIN